MIHGANDIGVSIQANGEGGPDQEQASAKSGTFPTCPASFFLASQPAVIINRVFLRGRVVVHKDGVWDVRIRIADTRAVGLDIGLRLSLSLYLKARVKD